METQSSDQVEEIQSRTFAKREQRISAILVDILICIGLSIIPWIGGALSIGYFLLRDALPWTDGRSVGKQFVGIRVITEEGEHLNEKWVLSALRAIVLYIPFFFIFELVEMGKNGENRRWADKWAKTYVIEDKK